MRICLVYDCLFPYTVGGAERWYRNLAEESAARGHEVTYLTLRQWNEDAPPAIDGVTVRAVGPRLALYTTGGRRRILPPIAFGLGVMIHLLRRRNRYDAVHCASFPYFSLLAAAVARPRGHYRLVVDWHEVWSREYWKGYLGPIGGFVGWRVQDWCIRVRHAAFCFSRLHADRLLDLGFRGEPHVLRGEYAGPGDVVPNLDPEVLVVFAGRHIPEKQVASIVPAIAEARRVVPDLRAEIYGDGPTRSEVIDAIAEYGLDGVVVAPGFVSAEEIDRALSRAMCLALPSTREGYGMVVVEAASHGTPSVLVEGPDNAAVELIRAGENGIVAPSRSPADLSAAFVEIHQSGRAMRRRTSEWFASNLTELSLASSIAEVLDVYSSDSP